MCGIAGIFDLKQSRPIDGRVLKRMTDAIAHRGPDGEGFFVSDSVGLGHRRLAIIDIEGGVQPFHSRDGRGVLCYNGEIYNYRELRREFEAAGVAFKTNSDTEVLTEGLRRFGPQYISKLRGMFAIAFFDREERSLLLARDRFGEKPVYYCTTPDGYFLFGSEISAIRAAGLTFLERDPAATRDYLLFGYVPDPRSIYKTVSKLPPGSFMKLKADCEPTPISYWAPKFAPNDDLDFGASTAELLDRIDDAVDAQRVSDVPLGAFLSGGVDSAAVVSSMALKGGRIETCTIGFQEAGFDERETAALTANRYGVTQHVELLTIDGSGLIDKIAQIFGEPFADPSALPTFLVSKAARRHVKAALSGDGADELFGGYRRYALFAAEERLRALAPLFLRRATFGVAGALYPKLDWAPRPLRLKTTLQALAENSVDAYVRAVSTSLPERLNAFLSQEFKDQCEINDPAAPFDRLLDGQDLDPLSTAQAIDFQSWLPGRMLTKVDRASMANGLEVRTPFLDHKLAEWTFSLPATFKLDQGVGKRILKRALEPRIANDVLYKPKQGFGLPIKSWLMAANGPLSRLRDSALWRNCGAFNATKVEKMMAAHQKGAADYSAELWAIIMFDAFLNVERGCSTNARHS